MKKKGTTHKFIISFLSFYIIISLSVNVINEDIFHAFVTGSVIGYSSANAIDDNKDKDKSVLGMVADSNPMLAYVDEYQTDKLQNSDPMYNVMENAENPEKSENESSESKKETGTKKEEKNEETTKDKEKKNKNEEEIKQKKLKMLLMYFQFRR